MGSNNIDCLWIDMHRNGLLLSKCAARGAATVPFVLSEICWQSEKGRCHLTIATDDVMLVAASVQKWFQ